MKMSIKLAQDKDLSREEQLKKYTSNFSGPSLWSCRVRVENKMNGHTAAVYTIDKIEGKTLIEEAKKN